MTKGHLSQELGQDCIKKTAQACPQLRLDFLPYFKPTEKVSTPQTLENMSKGNEFTEMLGRIENLMEHVVDKL